jgi:hypothetical protein
VKIRHYILVLAPLWLAAAPASAQIGAPPAGSEAPGGESASADPLPENWLETRIAIEDLADAAEFGAAIALGDRLLELALAQFGPASAGLAEAHLLLADVHRRNQAFQAAEPRSNGRKSIPIPSTAAMSSCLPTIGNSSQRP